MLLGNTLEEPRILGAFVTDDADSIPEATEVLTAGNVPIEEICYDSRTSSFSWRVRYNGRYSHKFAMPGDILVADSGFAYRYPTMAMFSKDYVIISEKGDSE
jgi:hypothetical protein